MKIQLIIAVLITGLVFAQEDRRPGQPVQRQPGDTELPFPPPRRARTDGEQPRDRGPGEDRPGERRIQDPERRGFIADPSTAVPLNRMPLKMQPYIGLVTRMTGPELAAQLNQPEGFGLVVDAVLDDSPAKAAGLERNDLLQKLDDQWLVNPQQLEALVRRAGKGGDVTVTILRGGAEKKIGMKVGEKMMPERRPVRVFDPTGEFRDPREGQPQPRQFDSRTEELPAGPGEPRPERGRARVVRSDDSGDYEIRMLDGRGVFTVKKRDGSLVWSGPVGTPEERAAMPEDVRKKFEEVERSRPAQRPGVNRREGGQGVEPRPQDPSADSPPAQRDPNIRR